MRSLELQCSVLTDLTMFAKEFWLALAFVASLEVFTGSSIKAWFCDTLVNIWNVINPSALLNMKKDTYAIFQKHVKSNFLRLHLFGLGYLRLPYPRTTRLAEVIFTLFLCKIQSGVNNEDRETTRVRKFSRLGSVTLASGTTFPQINA